MDNCVVSIVIPVYNVETYIEECIKSCLMQDYDKCEIVLVDDGSTDSSGLICDNYQKSYKNIKCYHKINGGLSDARNYGIEKASGNYIMFVDSDDVIEKTIVSCLLKYINYAPEIEMAICSLCHFADGSQPQFNEKGNFKVFSRDEGLIRFLYQKEISPSACAKLYKKELLLKEKFIKGQRFEDNDFMFRILSRCENSIYTDAKLYAYRHRNDSITTSDFGEKEFDIIDISQKIMEKVNVREPMLKEAARVYHCTNCFRIYLTATCEYISDNRYTMCKNYLKNNARYVLKDRDARLKLKIGLLLFSMRVPQKVIIQIRNMKKRWG